MQGGHEGPHVPGTGQQGSWGGIQLGPGGFIWANRIVGAENIKKVTKSPYIIFLFKTMKMVNR